MLTRRLNEEVVFVNPHVADNHELLEKMIEKAKDLGLLDEENTFLNDIEEKELSGVTELAPHIILPHARGAYVKKLFVMLAVDKKGVEYKGAKKNLANIILLIGVPKESQDYLKLLASISRLMLRDDFVQGLLKAEVTQDVLYTIKNYEVQIVRSEHDHINKYMLILNLNKTVKSDVLAGLLAEVGVASPVEIEGKNMSSAARFIPFLATFGVGTGVNKYNQIFMGITDEKDAAARLFTLLKQEGVDLNENGAGFLAQVETMESFGGFAPEMGI